MIPTKAWLGRLGRRRLGGGRLPPSEVLHGAPLRGGLAGMLGRTEDSGGCHGSGSTKNIDMTLMGVGLEI